MERTYINEVQKEIGSTVKVQGFIENLRNSKYMAFIVLKDITGKLQITVEKADHPDLVDTIDKLTPDSVITVTAKVMETDYVKMGGIEMIPEAIEIESIADEVLAAGQRIVMLTGPSAAGKTTSAHKIAGAIAARGHSSQVVSLDDFYIGEGKYPKNPDGSDDYESLESLDLERLHFCLKELYKTGICEAPVFDFTLQQPSGTRRIDARGGVVIIEGLHALNPTLTEELPAGAALCLYAGLREEYADSSDVCCLATRDIRLARRIVRDYLFRGHGAAFTLGLWGHVCAGEERFIKPYKPRANLLLDTTHTYEVCLWRTVLDAMPADP